ncbi:MAG: hypothetical protein O7D32_03060 [bacterium]|nr:hypothetical protein [bacterium]
MATHKTRVFIAIAVAGVFGCATEGGRVSSGIYTSPLYNFKVSVPDMGVDSRIEDSASDQSGSVTFYDGHASLLRIEYLRMNPDAAARHSDPQRRDYAYRNYALEYILPSLEDEFPGTEILFDEYVGKDVWRSYFFVVRVPGGFTFDNPETGKKRDATIAYLMFSSGDFMYVLAEEKVSEDAGSDMSRDEYRSMAGRLVEFGSTITFE